MVDRQFVPGLDLSQSLYEEAVRPILGMHFPDLVHSAGLLGPGSEVLGYADHETHAGEIDRALREELPFEIRGYPTNLGRHEDGTAVMVPTDSRPIRHGVTLLTVEGFFPGVLDFDPSGEIRPVDWLSVPENHLLMVTAGRVFHDGLGQLEPIRARLCYYPHEVWLYLLAAQWRRIGQEEAFMGRCGQVGDDLGSRLVAARLVRDLMHLCFLMERRYAPYIKWFGAAFAQLACAAALSPLLTQVLAADSWQLREEHLTTAYEFVASKHNDLGITETLPARVSQFHNRPFQVIHADRFARAIRAAITSAEVLALPEHLGSVDQFLDSMDALRHLAQFKTVLARCQRTSTAPDER
jgi:hypothetical protein